MAAGARGLVAWRAALARGLLPDDEALAQLCGAADAPGTGVASFFAGRAPAELAWPEEPLRGALLRGLAKLGVTRFATKYPAVTEALLKSVLEVRAASPAAGPG